MARIVVTKIYQRVDNVNADLNSDDDYVKIAEANITLGAAAGDILKTGFGGSYLVGDSALADRSAARLGNALPPGISA